MFERLVQVCVLLLALLMASTSEAATPVQDPSSVNNLYQIINQMMGTSFTSSQDPNLTSLEVVADDYWHEWNGYISIVSTYAGYDQEIYWENAGMSTFVHAAAEDGLHNYESNPINFQTSYGDFWFKDVTSGGTWYSREDLNSDTSKHIITYSFGDDVFVCAVEDLNGLGDQDYNDLVFKLDHGAAPVNVPAISYIPDQAVSGGYPFPDLDLNSYVRDDDSSVTWTTSGETALSIDVNQSTGVASVSYTSGWTGSENITFTATDDLGFYDSDVVTFTVNPPDAPVVADIPDQVITDGEAFAPIPLDDYVDHPAPNITDEDVMWSTSGEDRLTITIDSDRVAHIDYPPGISGAEEVVFTATINPSSSNPVTFTILAGSSSPGGGRATVGGSANPVNKMNLLAPWLALGLITAVGMGLLVAATRKRKVR